ncbi:hypothetical protein [Zhongshania sp. BJYM1]|uniref:hypothetical protein n=1 Tax=Zhongshania aquatica TaxID=2965069 RepID=UPI0022B45733|nr:hypothetical protein [Marortus sp. BJYM1]
MLSHALSAFGVAAVGGLVLAASMLRNKFPPWTLSPVHTLLGTTGCGNAVPTILTGLPDLSRAPEGAPMWDAY